MTNKDTIQSQNGMNWQKRWRDKYDIGSWVAPNGQRYTYSEIHGFIQSEIKQAEQRGAEAERERIIQLSEKIEVEDSGGMEEWKAFKRLRNTLRANNN